MQLENCNVRVCLKTLPVVAFAALCMSTACLQEQGDDGGDNGGTLAPASVSGELHVASFTVPAGQTTTVTSDLTLNVSGDVRIDGQLVASPAASDSARGVNITIIAQGSIEISGIVQAGDGMSVNATSRVTARQQPAGDSTTGRDGNAGGAIQLVSDGDLTILDAGSLSSGSGSSGSSGTRGGHGGDGGNIVLCAGNRLMVRGRIQMANGGAGGNAQATSDENIGVFPNGGGNSGSLYADAISYDWPGFDANDISIDPVAYATQTGNLVTGGYGGHAGSLTVQDDPFACVLGSPGQDTDPDVVTHVIAGDGGHGWQTGGNGGTVLFGSCTQGGPNGRDGTNWAVQAGHGGSVTRREDSTIACVAFPVVVVRAIGGLGGVVAATAAPGLLGDSMHPDGGHGGDLQATGGDGGHGEWFANQIGGSGGRAIAVAGFGGAGWCRGCDDLGAGGNGGDGGDGMASGGTGGDGVTPGNGGTGQASGADPLDVAARGGDGGDGFPPGVGGAGGFLISITGADGSTGNSIVGTVQTEDAAANGLPGSNVDPSNCP